MSNFIHPTAIVHENAKLGESNYIGPYCLIGPNVTIGSGNRFEAYVSIGTPGEHRDYFHKEPGPVSIGSNNVIREFVTINGGTVGVTEIHDGVVMLRSSHLGHDVVIRSKVNLSCNVLVGGHTIVGEGANLGLGAAVHQHRAIGAFAMVGMNSTVTRNILPFVVAFGTPAESQKINLVGITRSGVEKSDLGIFEEWFFKMGGLFENPGVLNHKYSHYLNTFLEDKKNFEKK